MDTQHVIHENQKVPCTKGLSPKDVFPGFDPTRALSLTKE
jgi:hypothetical protein